jgi:hypothetical protein
MADLPDSGRGGNTNWPDSSSVRAPGHLILVPIALVLTPVLIEMLGIARVGWGLEKMADEAAALASAGAAPQVIAARIDAHRAAVDGRFVDHVTLCSRAGGCEPRGWRPLGSRQGRNDVRPGDRIRVRIEYEHRLVLGGLLAPLFGADANGEVQLRTHAERSRE